MSDVKDSSEDAVHEAAKEVSVPELESVWSGGFGDSTRSVNKVQAETKNAIFDVEEVCRPGDNSQRCRILRVRSKGNGEECKPGDTSERCKIVTVTTHGDSGRRGKTMTSQSSFKSSSSLFGEDASKDVKGSNSVISDILKSLGSTGFDTRTSSFQSRPQPLNNSWVN